MTGRYPLMFRLALLGLFCGLVATRLPAQEPPASSGGTVAATGLFERPALEIARARAAALMGSGRADEAVGILQALWARAPDDGLFGVMLAAAQQATGTDPGATLRRVRETDPCALAPFLGAGAPDAPDPADCVAPSPPAAAVRDGLARVSPENTRWDPRRRVLVSRFAFGAVGRTPVVDPGDERRAARLLARLYAQGRAAGNHGDLYDNRDRGHAGFGRAAPPQIARVAYDPAAVAAGVDYALNDFIEFDTPTVGNASLALTAGRFRRSLPRFAMTRPLGAANLCGRYGANQVYVYPEHRDYDPDLGDLYPAATPCALISQGSSRSVSPHLEAMAMILAALRPDVKARLAETRSLGPALQMIYRRGRKGVLSDEDYLSAAAHPTVFDAADIDLERMVRVANAIEADAPPPLAQIAVAAEEASEPWEDYARVGYSRVLFDTPFAVARIFRGPGSARRFVLDARASVDPANRPLRFHWRVLRGDPESVVITPRDEAGAVVEVTARWRDPAPAGSLGARRLDIGVFADNGAQLSAPALFSLAYPPQERRRLDESGALVIDYVDPVALTAPADPAIFLRRDWRDVHRLDAEGRSLGWTRERAGRVESFTHHGARILTRDALDRPDVVEAVFYGLARDGKDRIALQEVPPPDGAPPRFVMRYSDEADRIGTPERLP